MMIEEHWEGLLSIEFYHLHLDAISSHISPQHKIFLDVLGPNIST